MNLTPMGRPDAATCVDGVCALPEVGANDAAAQETAEPPERTPAS